MEPETEEKKPVKEEALDTMEMEEIDTSKWSKEMNDTFIELLIEESSKNFYDKNENDWSKESWARIVKELEEKFPLKAKVKKFDRTKLRKHLKLVKKEHNYWKFIKENARGFHYSYELGAFSIDSKDVERHFIQAKNEEDPEVVELYIKKKSWLKKFCVPHSCEYLARYDSEIVEKIRSMEIDRKRKLMFDDSDGEDKGETTENGESGEVEGDGENEGGEGGAEGEGEGDEDSGEEDTVDVANDDEENELLALTGYAVANKTNGVKKQKVVKPGNSVSGSGSGGDLEGRGARNGRSGSGSGSGRGSGSGSGRVANLSDVEVARLVMTAVLSEKLSTEQQAKISELIEKDYIVRNFLKDGTFGAEQKLDYLVHRI